MAKNSKIIRSLTFSAIMIALAVVLTRFGSFYIPGAPFIRIGFGSIPTIVTSLVAGPIWGLLVGAGSDLIGALLFPVGAFFPGYTIDAALQGVIPYFVVSLLKGRYKRQSVVSSIFIAAFIMVIIFFSAKYSSYRGTELADWLRVTIPVFFGIYFLAVYTVFHFMSKTKTFSLVDRSQKRFSLFDIYIICLVNEVIISMGLLGIWNGMVFQLDWLFNAFTQALTFTINGVIRTFVLFFILNALFKLDNTMETTLKIQE